MFNRRNPRRRGRVDAKSEDDDGSKPRAPSSRRRSRPMKSEDAHLLKEKEMDSQEEIIESGKAHGSEEDDGASKRNAKRKRNTAASKAGVSSTEPYAYFEGLLLELMEKEDCKDFLRPVLSMWSEEDVPEYRERIKEPMDLGTARRNMKNNKYVRLDKTSNEYCFDDTHFLRDVRLVFQNCMEYNEPGSHLYKIASECLEDISEQTSERDARKLRHQEKMKRENERKKRKAAEEQAARAAFSARKAAVALAKAKKEAEEMERRRLAELHRREEEWRRRMEEEKEAAIAAAVTEALEQERQNQSNHEGKMANTSSVSSDENEGHGEVAFLFVSTKGMEKKRGRKSGVVVELEAKHDELMKKRKVMVDAALELQRDQQIEMTFEEKEKLSDDVAKLDFVRMKAVVDILAKGMDKPEIRNEVEVNLSIEHIDNRVLREIQHFLKSPTACTAREAVRQVETDMTEIENKLIEIRYQKIAA